MGRSLSHLAAIVLGAAAGGGFPQWNCRCAVCRLAWAGDKRVKPRTQASLAVSADGEHWILLNASPDLRAQIQANQNLHPRGQAHDNARGSPIAAVVLTGAEIDQTAGLLSLRERSPFTLHATAATLAAVADNPMFAALAPDVVARHAVVPGQRFALGYGIEAELFIVPGKVPLYLEGDDPDTASESAANVGVEISSGAARLAFVPGAAAITPAVMQRLARADVIFFDGTLFTRRRDDRDRHRQQRPAGAWATCRSTDRTARSRRSTACARAASSCTSTTPIRS